KRANFLRANLEQLLAEFRQIPAGLVEVLVSDNCSPDNTPEVVAEIQAKGLPVHYVRNAENIGSDANIAQSFNLSRGQYVLIQGDDDLFVDGALSQILDWLAHKEYGVISLRAYGFEQDFRAEYPGAGGKQYEFKDAGAFLAQIGAAMTLISSNIINKRLLTGVDAREFCGGNLVQVHLLLQAALQAESNLLTDQYLMACQRNNSGGYNFFKVFIDNLFGILDQYQSHGLNPAVINRIERGMLIKFFPFYILKSRLGNTLPIEEVYARFVARFRQHWFFPIWITPGLRLPRPFALAWLAGIVLIGRAIGGDFRRGLKFLTHKLSVR
ncbi:MAG: glycosyltransferase family 2 protein, partial [Methylobacillus glycogenes]|nr:glycosyltransferase family 2 protein [Methylobacillus glycogenes]